MFSDRRCLCYFAHMDGAVFGAPFLSVLRGGFSEISQIEYNCRPPAQMEANGSTVSSSLWDLRMSSEALKVRKAFELWIGYLLKTFGADV